MGTITQIIDSSIFLLVLTSILAGLAVPVVGIIMIKLGIVKKW